MNKISIIVPVYNAENSIEKTLISLLDQSFNNIEIICVDDGSTDGSLMLLKSYSHKHPNIKVIHQSNQGVSVARNTGIDNATGDIIMFVDADDEIEPYTCQYVDKIFNETNAEVFTFGFRCKPEKATPLGMKAEQKPPKKIYEKFSPELLFKDKARPYTCRTAVSKDLMDRESIRFEPGLALGEDQVVYFLIYPLSKKTVLSPNQFYIYNMHNESATHENASSESGSLERLNQHLLVIKTILREWNDRALNSFCDSELIEWMLDFVMFDIDNIPQPKKQELFSELIGMFTCYLGCKPSETVENATTRRCLKDIETALSTNPNSPRYVSILHLGQFYLMRYGLVRCLQQILIGLGLLKKWK